MKTLLEIIREAETKKTAVGHFNISDLVTLKAIFAGARELTLPVVIGVSEGERDFIGVKQIMALVKSLREEFDYPIFLNADHTHSLEKIKEAVEAGFDAVLFDGGKLPLEENIEKTKEVMEFVKNTNPEILVEGELGYIGSGSTILKEIPEDAAVKPGDLTNPDEAVRFVKETGVDLLSPAVGNLHGMFADMPNPNLDTARIAEIKKALQVASGRAIPLVLHGGSGIKDQDFVAAIQAGISIIHINTELRVAWKKGMEEALRKEPDEIVPYKLLPTVIEEVQKVVEARLRLFSGSY